MTNKITKCGKGNLLDLNVTTTKELLIDIRKQHPAVSRMTIDGLVVERVDKYKYLGVILDNKLKIDCDLEHSCQMSLQNSLPSKAEEHWHYLKNSSII